MVPNSLESLNLRLQEWREQWEALVQSPCSTRSTSSEPSCKRMIPTSKHEECWTYSFELLPSKQYHPVRRCARKSLKRTAGWECLKATLFCQHNMSFLCNRLVESGRGAWSLKFCLFLLLQHAQSDHPKENQDDHHPFHQLGCRRGMFSAP